MMTYVALLRGINVGGNNIIRMADLRQCLTDIGLNNIQTYIQSGNVVFDAKRTAIATLEKTIEQALQDTFDYHGFVVVLSNHDLNTIVAEAPAGFGDQPDDYRYDVIFCKKPMTPAKALPDVPTADEVNSVTAGSRALYFSRVIAKATKSKLSKIVSLPVYQSMTIRNWRTTNKLLSLAQKNHDERGT